MAFPHHLLFWDDLAWGRFDCNTFLSPIKYVNDNIAVSRFSDCACRQPTPLLDEVIFFCKKMNVFPVSLATKQSENYDLGQL